MEHMRMIIQIQAQIDSCLVDGGEEGLLSSNLGGGAGGAAGEPNPRLVRQAIKLLRMRHRVLQVRRETSMKVTRIVYIFVLTILWCVYNCWSFFCFVFFYPAADGGNKA